MRINVVAREGADERGTILQRLVHELATDAAFVVSEAPDPTADANLFFPYLEHARFPEFRATPTAAWFSHLDEGRQDKEIFWERAARAVDLRLTSAQLYEARLAHYGLTARLTPPLDTEHFRPSARQQHERRVVGTSGYVYPGGRKGEELLRRLAHDFSQCDFVASGRGWPVQTTHYDWNDMPDFYRTLDVYVCTSSIEGIGYGPLEAMACGVPVVMPRGVGIFDELPDLENLHRYAAGDYDGLRAALSTALERLAEGGYNPVSLRSAVQRYTRGAWVGATLRAFEALLYDRPLMPPRSRWADSAGVFYVAYGEPARDCARRAIDSFKRHMPGVPVALCSDTPLGAGEDVFIRHTDEDVGARGVKTQIYDLAPPEWEFVLYLDADTEVVADIGFLFQVLEDGWSAAFCTNPAQYVLGREMLRPDNADECKETFGLVGTDEFLQWNGGVFSFRRHERTARFFRRWHEEWTRYGRRDQAALDRVLYTEPIRVYVLGNEFNTITRYVDSSRTAGILHYPLTARRWRGMLPGRLDSDESWAALHPAYRPEGKA